MQKFQHHLAENLVSVGWNPSHWSSQRLLTCFEKDDRFNLRPGDVHNATKQAQAPVAARDISRKRPLRTSTRFVGTLFVVSLLIGAAFAAYSRRQADPTGEEGQLAIYYKEEGYMKCRYGCPSGPSFTECFNRCIKDLTGVVCDL